MLRVDFYICEGELSKEVVACKLIEKAYAEHLRIYVHTGSREQACAFDEQLWTFEDNSFIPHNLMEEKLLPAPPVRIGFGDIASQCNGTLLNLSNDLAPNLQQFTRIIEIVDEKNKELKREQYKHYRAHNCDIQRYKV